MSASARRTTMMAYGSALLCIVTWGMVFPGSARLLERINAVQVVTLRFMLVSLSFAIWFALRPSLIPRLPRRQWLTVLVCGILAVPGSQLAVVHAQSYLSPPLAALLPTFAPAIACVLAAMFLGEHLSLSQAAGFAVALIGVVLILVVGAGTGVSIHASSPLGAAVGLITPLSWALYTLVVRSLTGRYPPIGIAGVVYITGTLTLAAAFPDAISAAGRLNTGDWIWLVLMATAGTVVPNVLWLVALRQLSVSRTTAFMYLIPVSASLWTLAALGRAPEAIALPGGLLVVIGVALTQRDRAARRQTVTSASPTVEAPLGQVTLPR
ncbi:MAG TPA: DMT family transporter [Solirubrobacteraceae bacterium]|nr:DMT family transporter [Solirubrobacteraceae bacterium]